MNPGRYRQLADMTAEQWATVLDNLPLVDLALRRSRIPSWDREDSWQDGVFGLAAAVLRHDPAKGALSSLAVWSIRTAVQRGRKDRLGSNYRRALYTGEEYEVPLSVDLTWGVGLDLVGTIPSDDHPEDDAVLHSAIAAVVAHCRDDVDRMAVAWAAGLVSISDAADGVRVTPRTLRNRIQRLQQEVA